jgi:hypothetical protein
VAAVELVETVWLVVFRLRFGFDSAVVDMIANGGDATGRKTEGALQDDRNTRIKKRQSDFFLNVDPQLAVGELLVLLGHGASA